MNKLPFTKEELLKEYKIDINQLLDECDWIGFVSDNLIIERITIVCNEHGLEIDEKKLLKIYKDKIKEFNLSREEWYNQYADWDKGVPKIVGVIYELIENKLGSLK